MKNKKLVIIIASLFVIQITVYTLSHLWDIKHESIYTSKFTKAHPNYRMLKTIDLSYEDLKEIPSELFIMDSLESIDLSGNNLIEFPYELLELPRLEYLNLEGNQIEFIHFTRNKVKQTTLKTLILNDNQISSFYRVRKLTNLEDLELSKNKLDDIFLDSNKNLVNVRLSFNNFHKIPNLNAPNLNAPNLEEVNLVGNKISNLDFNKFPPSLRKLYLANNQISTVISPSTNFFEKSYLEVLDLSENQIKEFPYNFHQFIFLETLNLRENDISEFNANAAIPFELLKSFDISANYFSTSDINMDLIFPNLEKSN